MLKVVQCPKCGWIQLTSGVKTFSCRKCGASRELRKVKIIKLVKDPLVARKIIEELRASNH